MQKQQKLSLYLGWLEKLQLNSLHYIHNKTLVLFLLKGLESKLPLKKGFTETSTKAMLAFIQPLKAISFPARKI